MVTKVFCNTAVNYAPKRLCKNHNVLGPSKTLPFANMDLPFDADRAMEHSL